MRAMVHNYKAEPVRPVTSMRHIFKLLINAGSQKNLEAI